MGRRRIHVNKKCQKTPQSKQKAKDYLQKLLDEGAMEGQMEVYACYQHGATCYHVGHQIGSRSKR